MVKSTGRRDQALEDLDQIIADLKNARIKENLVSPTGSPEIREALTKEAGRTCTNSTTGQCDTQNLCRKDPRGCILRL